MRRFRVKTLLNAVFTALDAEMEKVEGDTWSIENMAKEVRLRQSIVETLDNTDLKGKQLVLEVEAQIRELIRFKRHCGQEAAKSVNGGAQ